MFVYKNVHVFSVFSLEKTKKKKLRTTLSFA